MKTIYILRHFCVKDTQKGMMNSAEFNHWVHSYDNADLKYKTLQLPEVEKVYVSTQNRALKTAKYFKLDFESSALLQEVETYALFDTKWRFPKLFWLLIGRVFWFFNQTKKESRKDTQQRAKAFLQKLQEEKEQTVLLVSHGLFLKILLQELQKQSFQGDADFSMQCAKLYKYSYKGVQ